MTSENSALAEGDKNARKPPFRANTWYDRFFEMVQKSRIESIDLEFAKANIAADPSDANKFIRGLRFLGLIDGRGKATPKMDKLRLTGDEFSKNLGEIVREAYKDVFGKVILEDVKYDNLVNFFISKYDMPASFATRAVNLFIYFANKSSIPLSDDLKLRETERASPEPGRQRASKPSKPEVRREEKATESHKPDEIEELKIGSVRVWLPKGDLDAAETAKNLIDLYIRSVRSDKTA